MKNIKSLGKKMYCLWTSIASGVNYRLNKKDKNNKSEDIDSTCTSVSSLDLSGMNKEQAKAEIDRLINKKLEKVSAMEFFELDFDIIEKERRMVNANKRIAERRNKRKQKKSEEVQIILTDEGSFEDFKPASIFNEIRSEANTPNYGEILPEAFTLNFDEIQPETFIPEEKAVEEPIKGQISMFDSSQEEVNTSFDSAIDKVFDFYGTNIARLVQIYHNAKHLLHKRLTPLFMKIEDKAELKNKLYSINSSLAKKIENATDKMYTFIEFIDMKNDAASCFASHICKKIHRGSIQVREFGENNRKKLIVGFGAGVIVYAAITMTIGSMTAYEYIYNGKVLGVAKNQEDVYKIVDVIGDKLSHQYDAEIIINKDRDIRFNKVIALNQEIDNKEDILNKLTYMRDMKVNGYGIVVDGRLVSVLESERAAKNVLHEVKNKFMPNDEDIELKEVGFAENVEIKEVETKLGSIKKKDQALEYIMSGSIEKKIHTVQSGETLSEISKIYGIQLSELQRANPEVIPEKIQIGQEICLNQIVPLVTVETVEVAKYKETIPYEIAYKNTSSLYKNEQTVKSLGINGEKDVVAEIIRHNGIEVSRKEIKSTIITEPVPQVVLVGTKEPPPLIGTGKLIYPIRGKLTSRYGTRWGRLHKGIDLAAPTGTKIKAADGGKVIFSGYNGALGYTVKIDHGGGRVTVYGHCSKLHVKAGERVYQGQHIANVGNTGRSTGPHVHFEVHVNGKAKNPLNYL
jgi:murein DD-endopeptidase MepM/ murein hydrolase activator NlpD